MNHTSPLNLTFNHSYTSILFYSFLSKLDCCMIRLELHFNLTFSPFFFNLLNGTTIFVASRQVHSLPKSAFYLLEAENKKQELKSKNLWWKELQFGITYDTILLDLVSVPLSQSSFTISTHIYQPNRQMKISSLSHQEMMKIGVGRKNWS